MAKLAINVSGAGNSDQYGTFINFNNLLAGNVIRGLEITQNSSPDMTVRVKAGNGIVREGSWPGEIGWHVAIDTADPGDSVTIATSDPSNARIDYVLAWIDKTAAASPTGTNNTNVFKVTAVAGTPSGSPVVPTSGQIQTAIGASNPYFILAQIAVGAAVTQVTTANITDLRSMTTVPRVADASITASKVNFGGAGTGIWWEEIGRVTLSTTAATMTVSSLPLRKYLRVIALGLPSGASNIDLSLRLNGDTATNYSMRYGDNGADDALLDSNTSLPLLPTVQNGIMMAHLDVMNIAAYVKLVHGTVMDRGSSNAATTHPGHREIAGKWINTSNAISSVTIFTAGTYAAGSEIVVLGHD